MSKEFDNILDECLERLLIKGKTIEQCLQSYPEQAADLKPLLQMALAARQAAAVQPRAEFKASARYQFQSALQEISSPKRRPLLSWFPRWATVVTTALGVLLMGGGTIAAASYSMPDSLLYPIKLATEQVRLALTPSDIGKAELCAKFADRRVAEIIYTANKGDIQRVEAATQRLDERLVMLASLTSSPEDIETEAPRMLESAPPMQLGEAEDSQVVPVPGSKDNRAKLRTTVADYAAKNPSFLRAALEKAPESAKSALRRAINVAQTGYEKALKGWD